ncbi:hypothetical protein D3C81_384520 [compost metagenome]
MDVKITSMDIDVTTTRKIRYGVSYRMSPSYGCLDIKAGVINVITVGARETMEDDSYDYESWEVEGSVHLYWVKYKYQDNGETDILPLEIFVEHISIA